MTNTETSVSDLDTPALWLDLDILERNIDHLKEHFGRAGVGWRPHIKGVKVSAIAQMAVRAGAIGVTSAKVSEAEVMVRGGIPSVLIANQIVTDRKIRRLAALQNEAEVMAAADDANVVSLTGRLASEAEVSIPLLVDVNTGMNRSGVRPGREVVSLAQLIDSTPGVEFRGVMAWEGHAVDIPNPDAKEAEIRRSVGELIRSADMCRQSGLPVKIVSGGGSGTYKIMPREKGVTEIQAGGAMFSDASYPLWGVETQPALFVRSTVTSRPAPDIVVFDAGFKALPAWAGAPYPLGLEHVASVAPSAEHGVVRLSCANTDVRVGQAFDFVVGYCDSTVFLHDVLYGVRIGRVQHAWPVEGRGKLL